MSTATTITRAYDAWLAEQIPVVRADIAHKHGEMRADRFRFLRGTYYLWLPRVVEVVPEVLDSVRVPLVGDLHVENFGTWRDAEGMLRWGVNDLDELALGPWLLDLLRLAVSATLAPHIALDDEEVCELVLAAYAEAKVRPAIELAAGSARHLRALVPAYASPTKFYAGLAAGHPAKQVPPGPAEAATTSVDASWEPTWHRREAGTGSLGHRRLVGVGRSGKRWRAREIKQLGPGTAAWAAPLDSRLPTPDPALYPVVLETLRGPRVAARVEGWQLRDLAPDVVRIELAGLRPKRARLVLRSMAEATAAIHGTDRPAWKAARREARALGDKEFRRMVAAMRQRVTADFHAYGG